jgi:hypothetical protein
MPRSSSFFTLSNAVTAAPGNTAGFFEIVAEVEGGEEEEEESLRRVKTSFLITCGPGILSLVPVPAAWLAGGAGVADTALLSLAATLPGGSCALVVLFCPAAWLAARPLVRIRGAAADCPVFAVVGLPALTVVTVWADATRVDACSLQTGSSADVTEMSDFTLKE